jgi:hypothetical protein
VLNWRDIDPALPDLADKWCATIREGDVIRTKSGSLRVVRAVHHHPKATGKGSYGATRARRTHCFFAIQRCSWTGAGYTVYNVAEMIGMGWLPTAARPRSLKAEIDLALRADFEARDSSCRLVKCCEAVGLP